MNTAGYQWLAPGFSNRDQETFKVDHYFTPNNHINVVFTHEVDKFTNTTADFPTQPEDANTTVTSYFASLGFTSTIRANLLNEVRMGMQHPDNNSVGSERAPGQSQLYPTSNGWKFAPTFTTGAVSPVPGNNDFEQVNPLYTAADTFSWVKGRHSFRWGAEVDYNNSNAYNIINGYVPTVYFGAGPAAVSGISAFTGIGGNQTLAQNMLLDLSGSVNSVSQGYGVPNGANPSFIPGYPNRRNWHQRGISGFFKDDFKVSSNLTLNLGMRWDWYNVPWDSFGRTPFPVGGTAGLFGISGTNDSAMWSPGAAQGALTTIQTVGKNSANPGAMLYSNYYKGFAPAVGGSWSIPYFGKDKTVLRMGYSLMNSAPFSILGIDNSVSAFSATSVFNPTTACNVNCVSLPLSTGATPLLALAPGLAAGSRTQTMHSIDADFRPPVTQNWNVSLERDLSHGMTFSVRYVGNHVSHIIGGTNLDSANIFENGILNAFQITQAGGNAPLFDQIFNGLNFGGTIGTVNGTTLTGSQALRGYSTTKPYFANNEPGAFANWMNTTTTFTSGVQGGLLSRRRVAAEFHYGQSAVPERVRTLFLHEFQLRCAGVAVPEAL